MFTWVTYNTEKKTQKLVVQHIHNFLTRERGSHNITKKIHTPTTRTHSTHILSSKSQYDERKTKKSALVAIIFPHLREQPHSSHTLHIHKNRR
jgi:hypothetical protein